MPEQTPADWLKTLPAWDGKPRVNMWLADYLGADTNASQQMGGRLFFLGMVARALNPGVPFSLCLVLIGEQAIGKSRAARTIGGEWYRNTPFDFNTRDSYSVLQNAWLYEFDDMAYLTRDDSCYVKDFLVRRRDIFRPVYARHEVVLPRQTVFIGTSNYSDVRPSRYFCPVICNEILTDSLAAHRDLLFAEALAQYTNEPQIVSRLSDLYTSTTEASSESACSGVVICPNCRQAINQQGSSESATFFTAATNSGSLLYADSARSIQPDNCDDALSLEKTSSSSCFMSDPST